MGSETSPIILLSLRKPCHNRASYQHFCSLCPRTNFLEKLLLLHLTHDFQSTVFQHGFWWKTFNPFRFSAPVYMVPGDFNRMKPSISTGLIANKLSESLRHSQEHKIAARFQHFIASSSARSGTNI